MPAQYAFVSQDRTGRSLADLAPFLRDRVITLPLNRPATVTGTMNLGSARASMAWLEAGVHELMVYRNASPIETVFRLTDVEVDVAEGGGTLKLEWSSIGTYLRDLVVPTSVTPITAAQSLLSWNLIADGLARTGAGEYDIVRGLVPSTDPSKTVTYDQRVDILAAIEKLSGRQDGFDFRFGTDRAFDVFYPWRGEVTDVVLEYPGAVTGIGYKLSAGPGRIATDMTGTGLEGREASRSDSIARDKYGRRESFPIYDEVGDATALQQYVDEDLTIAKQPIIVPVVRVSPSRIPFGTINLGDVVKLRAKAGAYSYVDIDDFYRVTSIKISLDNAVAEEAISYELNEARIVGVN